MLFTVCPTENGRYERTGRKEYFRKEERRFCLTEKAEKVKKVRKVCFFP